MAGTVIASTLSDRSPSLGRGVPPREIRCVVRRVNREDGDTLAMSKNRNAACPEAGGGIGAPG